MTDSFTFERVHLPAAPLPADNNVRHQYPVHAGTWVRHPDATLDGPSFTRFTLDFTLDVEATITLHVSADQRFELFCDGTFVGMGPDRSDIEHWSFHSYRLTLPAGDHQLQADVYFLGLGFRDRPLAQTTIKTAFVVVGEDSPVDLNTGSAPWQVTKLNGVVTSTSPNLRAYFVVGPNFIIDAEQFFDPPPAVEPVKVWAVNNHSESGLITPDWKLYPTRLPEQTQDVVAGGTIRFVGDVPEDTRFPEQDDADPPVAKSAWQELVAGTASLTVPPQTRQTVLWDLDEYRCAYPVVTASDGAGASITLEWAESCHEELPPDHGESWHAKGNRDEIAGKFFRGYGDTFKPDGPQRTFGSFWWRAGRYVRITVETADSPLTIDRLELIETRMPLENDGVFTSSDDELPPIIDVAVRGIQMCAHETYMDCPYYEQMMYVGDTRLQMLTSYVMSAEDRLNQRAIEIFDWSRSETGFVLERCPSQPKQLSCTFSMVYALILRDYAWWRDDPGFVSDRLKGLRCMLEEFKSLPNTYGDLLPPLPGWSFMDWVPGLSQTDRAEPEGSLSGLTNLLFLNALTAATELEEVFGEPHLAAYNRNWANRVAAAIEETFWNEQRDLFADDAEHTKYSEHAQCLALLSDCFARRAERCFASLISADDLNPTTVYFSFYLLETYAKFGRGDLLCAKLDFWKQMVKQGFKTPVESPEPSRSDCHAWGSHPLFHLHASLAGVRSAAPGFAKVCIAPSPGTLTALQSVIPHPAGQVSVAMRQSGDAWQTEVTLPAGVKGVFAWNGEEYPLGEQTSLTLPAPSP